MNDEAMKMPPGWRPGGATGDYRMGVDSNVFFMGKPGAFIQSLVPQPRGRATFWQSFPAYALRGKKIRLSGHVRTQDVEGSAGIWMRLDGLHQSFIRFDDMENRLLSGTLDWTKCEIVLEVREEVEFVQVGAYLQGAGQMWFAGLDFAEAAGNAACTDDYPITGSVPINLDFETLEHDALKGWSPWGALADKYKMGADEVVSYQRKRSACIRALGLQAATAGACYSQFFQAAFFRGKRVRFSGVLKTMGVTRSAVLFMRIDGVSSDSIAIDFMNDRKLQGTNDWKKCAVVLDVSAAAHKIVIGGQLCGMGQMWFDELKIETVGAEVPTTNTYKVDTCAPRNLHFFSQS